MRMLTQLPDLWEGFADLVERIDLTVLAVVTARRRRR